MTQKEFNKLTFSHRHEISKGIKCNASWQVRTIGGNLHAISCRECGTVLQSDCTPKCLLLHPPLTDANIVLCKPASESAEGAAVGNGAVGTVAERGKFDCYEIHTVQARMYGCSEQCDECAARKSSEGQP